MSGQQIGSAVGFVAGFFLPGGPSVWATIGGALGGAIDPTQMFGPRLTDGMGVTAQDGIPNPWGFGTFSCGCNVLNAFDLVEHKQTDDGKGSGQELVTYTYTRSYALGICRAKRNTDGTYTPIAGVLRVTHNGKLVYDASPDVTSEQLAQNAKFLKNHKFYLGGEDQLPDPTLESYLGVGEASAYRGQVYVVGTDVDQTETGGAMGTWEFVVAMEGASQPYQETGLQPGRLSEYANIDWPLVDDEDDYEYTGCMTGATPSTTFTANTIAEILTYFTQSGRTPTNYLGYSASDISIPTPGIGFDLAENGVSNFVQQSDVVDLESIILVYNDQVPTLYTDNIEITGMCGTDDTTWIQSRRGVVGKVFSSDPGAPYSLKEACGATGDVYGVYPLCIRVTRKRIAPKSIPSGSSAIPDAPGFYIDPDGSVHPISTYSEIPGNFHVLSLHHSDGVPRAYDYYETGPIVADTDPDYDNQAFWEAAYAASTGLPGGWVYPTDYPAVVTSAFEPEPLDVDLLTIDGVLLSTIVAEICQRSGLASTDIDVSELTDAVKGFKVAVETAGEAIIQSLMQGFFFDCGEWDDKLRFIKRGGDVVAELDIEDLVEREGPAIDETQAQEVELLRRVNVKAMDPDAGYVETTQTSERRSSIVDAKGEQTLSLPVVLDKDTQAQIADKRQKVAWGEIRRFKYTLPYTRADLTVTDNIGLTNKAGRRQIVRLMEMSEDTGRIEVSEAMLTRANLYGSSVEGASVNPPTVSTPGLIGPTFFVPMNLPSLRTQDNVPGVYVAACGFLSGWSGATILLSIDGGVSYQQVATFTTPSTMGRLTEDCTDSSDIEVFLNSGEVSSVTDAQIAAGLNAFAITTGDVSELGQVKTATQDSDSNTDLTDLMRGLKGTNADAHNTGDPFVMVATTKFLPLDISLAGKTLYFKAVSFGTSADDAEAVEFMFDPLFTSVIISQITVDGDALTVDGSNLYKVTTNA